MRNSLILKRTTSSDTDFVTLITMLDQDLAGKYPHQEDLYNQHNIVESVDTVIVAYEGDSAVGCGCFKQYAPDTVEVKRMFVLPDYRGRSISSRILTALETWASELGFSQLVLETGIKQHNAIGLYEKSGFNRIENYGPYIGLSTSVCYGKNLV